MNVMNKSLENLASVTLQFSCSHNVRNSRLLIIVRLFQISAPAMANPESGQVRLWPNFYPDLPDTSAVAVRSVSYG